MSLFHRYWWYGVIIAIAQILFWLSGKSSLPGGTWVSWNVKNALNIVTRYGVYSLLLFCNESCQCVNNFIGFSGKTLFQLSFIISFILTVQISFLLLSIILFLCLWFTVRSMSANKRWNFISVGFAVSVTLLVLLLCTPFVTKSPLTMALIMQYTYVLGFTTGNNTIAYIFVLRNGGKRDYIVCFLK